MFNLTRRQFLRYSGATGVALGTGSLASFAGAEEPLKIGVVYVSPIAEIGWTKQHSLGVDAIKKEFGDKVAITVIDNIFMPQDAERVFRELAASGNQLIFGTSFSHGTPMQKVAPRFPKTAFEHCSGIVHRANLGTFEAKYYEGTFVAGAAGGHMSKSGKIGFIGGFRSRTLSGRRMRFFSARRASIRRSPATPSSSTPGSTRARRRKPPIRCCRKAATSSVR